MKFAYADPPYLGCARLYAEHHSEAMIWDDPEEHRRLVERLSDEYPDGWALSLHVPSLFIIRAFCPDDVRIGVWLKSFAAFKPNVPRAYTWEPVIFRGGRVITREEPTWRDHLVCPIALKKGLTGAKPAMFCEWVLDYFNFQRGDDLADLFPGTGVMSLAADRRNGIGAPLQGGLFAEVAAE